MLISRRAFAKFLRSIVGYAVLPKVSTFFGKPGWIDVPEDIPLSLDPRNNAFVSAAKEIKGPAWIYEFNIWNDEWHPDESKPMSFQILRDNLNCVLQGAFNPRASYRWISAPAGELFVPQGKSMMIVTSEGAQTNCYYTRELPWKPLPRWRDVEFEPTGSFLKYCERERELLDGVLSA